MLEQVGSSSRSDSAEDLEDPTGSFPCRGAVRREHSHFFTADGAFGSRDENGQQVDEGTYTLEGDDVVVINGDTFHYRIEGDSISLSRIRSTSRIAPPGCAASSATWVLTVAMPGTTWTRASDPLD